MKVVKFTAISAAILFSSTAMANVVTDTAGSVVDGGKTLFKTVTNPAAVSLELGTLGYGANVAWGINDSVELQAGWAGMNFDVSTEIGGNDSIINWNKVLGDEYNNFEGDLAVDLNTSNPYLGVQMRPMNNWLTVGAGVIVPDHEISVRTTATANGDITVKGETYPLVAGDSVTIKAENHNVLAPYATLGFRPNINNRFGLFAEVGAAYVGKYDVAVESSRPITSGTKDLATELANEVKDSSPSWYPIAKAGVTYRF